MSVEVTVPTHSSIGFTRVLQSVFHTVASRLKVRRVADDMRGMTDRYLSDIGMERPLLSDAWERAIARDRLLESGWRYSQRV